jgi:DNA modification methylase
LTKEEMMALPAASLGKAYRAYSRGMVYSFEEHRDLCKYYDDKDQLPATFMALPPASWSDQVWDDVNRMRTLNADQRSRRLQMHVCPLQLDIVERVIRRYSNEGDLVLDPFAGIMTVPYVAVKMGRRGYGIELSADYFRDGLGYLREAEAQRDMPTLFDFVEVSV